MIHAIFTFRNFHYWFNGNANMAYIDHYVDKQNQAFPKGNPQGLGVKKIPYKNNVHVNCRKTY